MKTRCYHCGAEYEITWKDVGKKCECSTCHKKFVITVPPEEIEKSAQEENISAKTENIQKIKITSIDISIGNIFLLLLKIYIALIPFTLLILLFYLLTSYILSNHNAATICISILIFLAFMIGLPIILMNWMDNKRKEKHQQ